MRRLYTPEEDAILIKCRQASISYVRISRDHLDRSAKSLQQRAYDLVIKGKLDRSYANKARYKPKVGYTPKNTETTAIRKCLSCAHDFMSDWIGNRMCPRCKHYKRDYHLGY